MATNVQLRGIRCPDTVLLPQNEAALLDEIRNIVLTLPPSRQQRTIESISNTLISIRHKLTVAMYQAALLCELNPNDFTRFAELRQEAHATSSYTEYKICKYTMNDLDEYRLVLSFLIETFAATAFSLLDVTGHLLNELYGLGWSSRRVSFERIKDELVGASLHDFLLKYVKDNPNSVPWISTLTEIRHRTTHRPIVDVCDFETIRRSNIYAQQPHQTETIFLLDSSLTLPGTKIKFCNFVTEVFDGLEEFVEELYERLRLAVCNTGSLPIS